MGILDRNRREGLDTGRMPPLTYRRARNHVPALFTSKFTGESGVRQHTRVDRAGPAPYLQTRGFAVRRVLGMGWVIAMPGRKGSDFLRDLIQTGPAPAPFRR